MKKLVFLLGMLCIYFVLTAQETRVITGIINDPETGDPLPGVSISIKGANQGTITDLNGYYSINVPVGETLVFSYVGYISEEVVVGPRDGNMSKTKKIDTLTHKENTHVYRHCIPESDGKSIAPYFFVKSDDPETDRLPLKATSAKVNIAGIIADVTIRQLYVNEGTSVLEAIYIFPGSTRAAVYGMTMYIGDRKLDAKIKEKQEARTIYEEAKKAGKTSTLLEQNRPNVFQTNVANIMPGDSVIVELRYTEMVEPTDNEYEFVYPAVVGPRYSTVPDKPANHDEKWISTPYLKEGESDPTDFNLDVKLKTAIPLEQVVSPSHNIITSYQNKNEVSICLPPDSKDNGNRDFILKYKLESGKIESGILVQEAEEENYFTLMLEPPEKITPEFIPPREYIFIVDVSGSMNGFPIDVSKKLIKTLLKSLKPTDKFNILAFAGGSKFLASQSLLATDKNIEEGISFMDNMQGGGGTELLPALKRAMNYAADPQYSRIFIIATDGLVTIEREAFNYIRENLNQANLFAFGIGSSVNRYLIEGLAHAGMGEPCIVTSVNEAEEHARNFIETISSPVLTGIHIDWGKLHVYDVEPAEIPDIFSSRPVLVYGKYKGDLQGKITISGFSGNQLYKNEISLDTLSPENNNAVKYLWARKKLTYLSDYAQYYTDEGNRYTSYSSTIGPNTRQNIINLGLKYNLLTEFTSFVAVDDRIRNTSEENETVKQPLPLPKGLSNLAVQGDINVSLSADEVGLEEVVVVGYGSVKKSDLTSAVTTVTSQSVQKVPPSSVSEALQGRVAGVTSVQNSGSPGSSMSIRIRGTGSISSPNPLFVIDGIPVTPEEIYQLNANDIASIDVCKDASASAIYGSSAANGVILITTKKDNGYGKQINFSSSYSIDMPSRLPKLQNSYGHGLNVTAIPTLNTTPFSWGRELTESYQTFDSYDFFKNGYTLQNHFSASMKKEKKSYYFSVFDIEQQGIIPQSKYYQRGIDLKYKAIVKRKLEIEPSFRYTLSKSKFMKDNMYLSGIMYGVVTTPPDYDNRNQLSYDTMSVNNPYSIINKNRHEINQNTIISSLNIKYKLFRRLYLKYSIKYRNYYFNRNYKAANKTVFLPDGELINIKNELNGLENMAGCFLDFHIDNIEVNYNFIYTNKLLNRYIKNERFNNILQLQETLPVDNVSQELTGKTNLLSSTLNITFNNLLTLSGKLGNTWTSFNHEIPDNSLSWSVSGGFNFSELHIVRNSYLLSFGKLRASCSRNFIENPVIDNYENFNSTRFQADEVINHFNPLYSFEYNDLLPEQINTYNLGIDINLFGNRFTSSFDWYYSKNDHVISAIQQNKSFSLINSGRTHTNGWEFEMNYRKYSSRVDFNSQLVFTRFNTMTDAVIPEYEYIPLAGFEDMSAIMIPNKPYGAFYGTRYLRNAEGNMIIGPDGYPLVDDDKGIIGNPTPDFIIGLNNEISFKEFYMSMLLEYRHGGDVWNGTKNTLDYLGISEESAVLRNTQGYIFEGVTETGETNTTPVDFANPELSAHANRWLRYGKTGVAEDGIEDGTYLKIRNVKFGYIFPEHLTRNVYLEVYVYCRNLLTLTHYRGIDPETTLNGTANGTGIDYFNLPSTRSIGFGLEFTF